MLSNKMIYITMTCSCFSFSIYIKQISMPSCLSFCFAFKTFVTIPDTTSLHILKQKIQ